MSYPERGYRLSGGFRDDPEHPADSTSFFGSSSAGPDDAAPASSRRPVTKAELDVVFDDPRHGDPGMDRVRVHLLWELALLLGVAGMALYFRHAHAAGISGDNLRDLVLAAAVLGFLTLGVGLSLRAGAVNLAVGPIAAGAELFFATHSDRGLLATIAVTLLLSAGVGVAIGLAVTVPHVPAWAASLAGAFVVVIWIQKHVGTTDVTSSYHPRHHAYYWFAGFVALALLGGILGLVRSIRRGVGWYRPTGDPAARQGRGAAVVAFLAITASSVLAGLAGVLGAVSASSVAPRDGFLDTGLALGAALAAGTSAFGRRGGIFGTILSVSLIALVMRYGDVADLRISPYAVAAVAIGGGLVVTRLVERYGRPAPPSRPDERRDERREPDVQGWTSSIAAEPTDRAGDIATGWSATRQDSWTSQLAARSTDDTWGGAADERWDAR